MRRETRFLANGYRLFPQGALTELDHLLRLLEPYDRGKPGQRISGNADLASWLAPDGVFGAILYNLELRNHRPVRAVLFDKSAGNNWALGWHQDRTICVRHKIEEPGFGPYSVKDGLIHVEPPFTLIERMTTLRIHIDPVDETNAPLIVAQGSHKQGRITTDQVEAVAAASPQFTCLANIGDVWAYSTAILHASKRSDGKQRRRVLQVDYSPDHLPGGLEWSGI